MSNNTSGESKSSIKALQSEQTRDKIVLASARLFARKGYSATSIADISDEVGLTKGALYHHFTGKEAVFYAVVERIRSTWRTTVARQVVTTRDSLERLQILLDRQARFLQSDETFCLVLNGLMSEMEGVNEDLVAVIKDVYSELTGFIQQILSRGQADGRIRGDLDPALTALAIVGMLRGTGCSRPISERMEVSYVDMMESLKKVVIKGVQA